MSAFTLNPVAIDDGPVFYAAHVGATRWNGWLCPWFTAEEGKRIAAWTEGWDSEESEVIRWDEEHEAFYACYDGAEYLVPSMDGSDYGTGDGVILYGIGVESWVWSEPDYIPPCDRCEWSPMHGMHFCMAIDDGTGREAPGCGHDCSECRDVPA